MTEKRMFSSRKSIFVKTAFCLLFSLAMCLISNSIAVAQTDAYALIEQVNLLRAGYDLEPYTVDASLMDYAQAHSEYQAANQISTHLHSDGSIPQDIGLVENVAGGQMGYFTAEDVVFSVWDDPVHMKTLVGYATGSIGAGVASDGTDEYITIDVRPGGEALPTGSAAQAGTQPVSLTTIPVVPLITCTPQADGSIIHLVGYGQTLWAIAQAYQLTLDQLRAWNGYSADDSAVYAGQKLLVLPLSRVTVFPSATGTATAEAASATPSASPTRQLTPTVCCTHTVLNQPVPAEESDRSVIGLIWAGGLILVGTILLVFILFRSRN